MKTQAHRNASSTVNLGFQIAPMVDVVFVIMLFFMVVAGSVSVENRHNMQIPVRGDFGKYTDEIAIHIDDAGQLFLNDDPLDSPESKSLPELTENLKQLQANSKATQNDLIVTVSADETARYERVVDTLDALSRAEIREVSFTAGEF
jgi:biopolymer transport protein ExbD